MITDRLLQEILPPVPREKQEINFVVAPAYAFSFVTKLTNYVVDVRIESDRDIEAIDPQLIRGRHVEITYLEGGEELAKKLAYLIKQSQPLGAFYVTPRGEWVQLVDGHWKCLARIPNDNRRS